MLGLSRVGSELASDQLQHAMQQVLEDELHRAAVGTKYFCVSPYVTILKPGG